MSTESVVSQPESADPSENRTQAIPRLYRSKAVTPTGFWKQTVDPKKQYEVTNYETSLRDDVAIYPHQGTELIALPEDRVGFVQKARTRYGIADGSAHRMWLFIHGVKMGDWVVLD